MLPQTCASNTADIAIVDVGCGVLQPTESPGTGTVWQLKRFLYSPVLVGWFELGRFGNTAGCPC